MDRRVEVLRAGTKHTGADMAVGTYRMIDARDADLYEAYTMMLLRNVR